MDTRGIHQDIVDQSSIHETMMAVINALQHPVLIITRAKRLQTVIS
jgi:hypothetical protein